MSPSGRARRVAQQAVGSVQPPGPDCVLDVRYSRSSSRLSRMIASPSWPRISKFPSTRSRQLSSISRSASRSGRLATNRSTTVSPPGRRCCSANQSMAPIAPVSSSSASGRGLREACTGPVRGLDLLIYRDLGSSRPVWRSELLADPAVVASHPPVLRVRPSRCSARFPQQRAASPANRVQRSSSAWRRPD